MKKDATSHVEAEIRDPQDDAQATRREAPATKKWHRGRLARIAGAVFGVYTAMGGAALTYEKLMEFGFLDRTEFSHTADGDKLKTLTDVTHTGNTAMLRVYASRNDEKTTYDLQAGTKCIENNEFGVEWGVPLIAGSGKECENLTSAHLPGLRAEADASGFKKAFTVAVSNENGGKQVVTVPASKAPTGFPAYNILTPRR